MEYNNLSGYLRRTYGRPLRKICVDGGFTCPNRDGTCGVGGCIFCGERGAGEHLSPTLSIEAQVRRALAGASPDDRFIVYFQNFTNTYEKIPVLEARYRAALIDPRIVVLDVGTRPDCIDEDVCRLLASFRPDLDVWVELGLQTANDQTASTIHRGYPRTVFERAMACLAAFSLPVTVHLMVGLPGETAKDAVESAGYVASFHPFGVKIHSTYVMEGTRLADLFRSGDYTPLDEDDYVKTAADMLAVLPPETVVHRLTGDCPDGLLVAPIFRKTKNELLAAIRSSLVTRYGAQGANYKETEP